MSDTLSLLIEGIRYEGWTTMSITRSLVSFAGSFAVSVSDSWAQNRDLRTIYSEDACVVQLGNDVVLTGFVDRVTRRFGANARSVQVAGRDATAALVDCSAVPVGKRWTFRRTDLRTILSALAAPYGIAVTVQDGLSLPNIAKAVITPGEKVFPVANRLAKSLGVLVIAQTDGSVLLARTGSSRARAITEGDPILLEASLDERADQRFHTYVVVSQSPGFEGSNQARLGVKATTSDQGVRRQSRQLYIRAEQAMNVNGAQRRADWEARTRAATADIVACSVHGWRQVPNGSLWTPNSLVAVTLPSLGVDGDLLITGVTHRLNASGQQTDLQLMRPDAFLPQPTQPVARPGWKELRKGAL